MINKQDMILYAIRLQHLNLSLPVSFLEIHLAGFIPWPGLGLLQLPLIVTQGLELAPVKPVLRANYQVFHCNSFHIQLDCLLFVMLI